jgi:hypothetical protein
LVNIRDEKDLSIQELNIFLEKLDEDRDRLKRPLHVLNVFFMKDFFTKKETHNKSDSGSKSNASSILPSIIRPKNDNIKKMIIENDHSDPM